MDINVLGLPTSLLLGRSNLVPHVNTDVGDVVLARVQEVDECHNVVLTMKGQVSADRMQVPLSPFQFSTLTVCG